mmetsp:Transcript_9591/g.28635  ORF Transcript_9591/g.28635 Transcript_9591/m.28635 type:complete len:158 (-) Transcript_9591:121-594(-)
MRSHCVRSSFYTFFIVAISCLAIASHVVNSLQLLFNGRVKLKPSPLIGGPGWLPVHCKVEVGDSHVFDFVPVNAESTETIQKLITLQTVPATARQMGNNRKAQNGKQCSGDNCNWDESTKLYAERAARFCEEYDRDLHLVSNNCWSFAFDLIQYISD